MPINFTEAIAAYSRAAQKVQEGGGETAAGAGATDFASLVRDAATGTIDTLETAERESVKAAAGTGDINELVTAMAEAEIALQTVVTVRDRVIQAYQDIMRMPM